MTPADEAALNDLRWQMEAMAQSHGASCTKR